MKPHVFMIAIGEAHQEMAALTRPRAEKVLDLPITTLTEANNPWVAKLQLLERVKPTEHVLFLDTDLVLFGWDWTGFKPEAFNAAKDMLSDDWPGTEAIVALLPNPHLAPINSGLWLAPGSMAPVFRQALFYLENDLVGFPYLLGDQTALNYALHKEIAPVHLLPRRYNWQISPKKRVDPPPPEGVLCVHLIEGGNQKLDRVRTYCNKYPLP